MVCDTCGKTRLVAREQTPREAEIAAGKRGWKNTRRSRGTGKGYTWINHCSDCIEIYGGESQATHDKIGFTAVGAITQPRIPWVNRPTFQQAIQVQGHR